MVAVVVVVVAVGGVMWGARGGGDEGSCLPLRACLCGQGVVAARTTCAESPAPARLIA